MSPLPAAIPSPSNNVIDFGPLTVHIYGLCYAVGGPARRNRRIDAS